MGTVDTRGVTTNRGVNRMPGADQRARTVNLGRGQLVPYPEPADTTATNFGKANRRTDTKPELKLRSALHRRGLRFRKDHLICVEGVRVRPDIVFTRQALAVFVDGCFWHGCLEHQRVPRRNPSYWSPKLQANVERDRRVDAGLRAAGWRVERVWEHEEPYEAAQRIEALVRGRPPALQSGRSRLLR
jgi:DNA mismatch endonuclease (patch repair protein)